MPTHHNMDFDVRLSDVLVFLAVRASGSLTGAARTLDTTPSYISKALVRLERRLGARLLTRSGRGIKLTPAGARISPTLVAAAEWLERARRIAELPRDLTVAAPSYLLTAFLPLIAGELASLRFRALHLSPEGIIAAMGRGEFEVALSTGMPRSPASWSTEVVGQMHAGLFAQPALARALGKRPTLDALKRVPFIVPVAYHNGQWEFVDDGCPLPLSERIVGHESPAIGLALEIATNANQLTFAPWLAAKSLVDQGRLVEVNTPEWKVEIPIYLGVDIDRVSAKERAALTAVARSLIS